MYNYIMLTNEDKINIINEKIKNYEMLIYHSELKIIEENLDQESIDSFKLNIAKYLQHIDILNTQKQALTN